MSHAFSLSLWLAVLVRSANSNCLLSKHLRFVLAGVSCLLDSRSVFRPNETSHYTRNRLRCDDMSYINAILTSSESTYTHPSIESFRYRLGFKGFLIDWINPKKKKIFFFKNLFATCCFY